MRTDPAYRKITADEFLAMDFNTDRKFELAKGVIVMMTGGTEPHAWVQLNIASWLRHKLRGSSCRPYGSEMAIRVSETEVRYPDISIHCNGSRDGLSEATALAEPTVVIEVLSPSTTTFDQGTKLEEYKRVPSIHTIAFVDPVNEMCRTVERTAPNGWLDHIFSGKGGIEIPTIGLTIPHEEIFARD